MKFYICGDSFCCPDPEHGVMWVDLLRRRLDSDCEIVNLSQVAASNALISLQVDRAVESGADFVACHFTSCTRASLRVQPSDAPLLDQFASGAMIPYSIPTCTTLEPHVSHREIDAIRKHYVQYCDLDWEIYVNKCVIESVLSRLRDSTAEWQFDQGGFEHPSFGSRVQYFENYHAHRLPFSLWDFTTTRSYRPYFHIVDTATHQQIADYYTQWILQQITKRGF